MRAAGQIASALVLAVAIATLLGSLGEFFWAFDLLSNFRFQYLIGTVVLCVVLLAATRYRSAVLALVLILINGAVVAPLYTREAVPAGGDETLAVVSFNIQLSNPQRQLDWIMETDPDVVFIFESSRLAEEELGRLNLPYEIFSAIDEDRQYGPTVLIRPGMTPSKLPFSNEGGGAVRVVADLDGQRIAVYGIHPPSPSNPFRAELRDRFLERSGRAIAAEELPVIVAGDLNATPWANGFRLLADAADLVNTQEGYGYTPTWPAQLPWFLRIPLDHILHTRDLTVVDREVGPRLSSDHLPVRAEIGFSDV